VTFEQKFTQLESRVKNIGLSKDLFEDVLQWGELYGRLLYTNYPNTYRDDDFERLLVDKFINDNKLSCYDVEGKGELHLISEPYSTGGHTRLLERMIKIQGKGDVLVSRPLDSIANKLSVLESSKVFFSTNGFAIEDIIELAVKYKTIFLHIHPDDLLTSVAMGVLKRLSNTKVILINHADHIFSFGYYSSHVIAEMGPFGAKLGEVKKRGYATYLGVPFSLSNFDFIESDPGVSEFKKLNILSGGTGFKYKSALGLSFPRLVSKILKNMPQATVTVVGPKRFSDWWWWRAILRNPFRLSVVAKLPYEQYNALIESTDIYIDSFPLSGGTSVPEARGKGIPVTGVLSGSYGYTPWDRVKFKTDDELIEGLKEFVVAKNPDILKRNNNIELMGECSKLHGQDGFRGRLDSIVKTGKGGALPDHDLVNYNYFHDYWLSQKKLVLGKKSYKFLFENWSEGGREVMGLAIVINPLKYTFKLLSAIPLIFKYK
jgi:hypothetical protein